MRKEGDSCDSGKQQASGNSVLYVIPDKKYNGQVEFH